MSDQLREALNDLYVAAPRSLECGQFHHSKREQHRPLATCKPRAAYFAALDRAASALATHPAKGEAGDGPALTDAIVQCAVKWYDTGAGKAEVAHDLAMAVLHYKQSGIAADRAKRAAMSPSMQEKPE